VTIDSGCVIEDGVRLKNTVVLKGCLIKSHAWVDNSIIGWKSTVGKWVN
jgi:mannose-1-phosphate guanylyltransferase